MGDLLKVHELTHWLRRKNGVPDDVADMEMEADYVAGRYLQSLIEAANDVD